MPKKNPKHSPLANQRRMKNRQRSDSTSDNTSQSPDLNDPYRPDLTSDVIVECIHCGKRYQEKEIKWDAKAGLWVCKYWPECNGAGFGFDILKVQ